MWGAIWRGLGRGCGGWRRRERGRERFFFNLVVVAFLCVGFVGGGKGVAREKKRNKKGIRIEMEMGKGKGKKGG